MPYKTVLDMVKSLKGETTRNVRSKKNRIRKKHGTRTGTMLEKWQKENP